MDQPFLDEILDAFDEDACSVGIERHGYIIAYDDGRTAFWGIPDDLYKRLKGREGQADAPKPTLVALGSDSRYYIKFANGRSWWGTSASRNFCERMTEFSGVRRVAFGSSDDSWAVLHDGGTSWGYEIPSDLEDELRRRNPDNIEVLTMGPDDQWFIRSKNGAWQIDYGSMSSETLRKTINKVRNKGLGVREVLFGSNNTWVIRYSD